MEDLQSELLSSADEEAIEEAESWLEVAGIRSRISEAGALYSHSRLNNRSSGDQILYVRDEDRDRSLAVLEKGYLDYELPTDHYLFASSKDELAEILAAPSDWSPFDVAHAKRLLAEKGVDIETASAESIEERKEQLKRGIPAPASLILFGWVIGFCGGLIGILIGLSIATSKTKYEGTEYFTYNEDSQKTGKKIMSLGIIMLIAWFLFMRDWA
ncbi:MAG: hypothetical protein ACI9UA_004670 [Pseudoalteromonas tetraodonis]|jgi:hypothetical protein